MKKKSAIMFVVSAVLIVFIAFTLTAGLKVGNYQINPLSKFLKLGLDLKGGVTIQEEIVQGSKDKDTLARTKTLLESRVNNLGVAESSVTITGQNRFLIEIPALYNADQALQALGQTGKLTFVGPDNKVILTGNDVKDASVGMDQYSKPEVELKLNASGVQKFAEATQKFMGQPITIKMDEQTVASPTVQAVIADGNAVINNMESLDSAKTLAGIIKSGALPVTLKPATVQVIGPSLGQEAIPTSAKAAVIGIALVMLFMLAYYRLPGLIADLALTVYIIITILIFAFVLKATLTLPGIAGLLLSIGMAVDANVLIFERMKEELRVGKSLKNAIDSGFHRALSSIIDSNVTTLIAGFVLYFLGTGGVKGFALTLSIGVLCSMFTAITVTRFLLKSFVNTGWVTNTKYFGA